MNNEEVIFNICETMNRSCEFQVNSIVDVIDQAIESMSELACLDGVSLANILLNYDNDEIDNYEEVVIALMGTGSYLKASSKLDINLKS